MSSHPLVNSTPGMLLSSAACPSQLKNHLQKLFLFCSIDPALLCKHPQFWHVVEVRTQLHDKSKENIKSLILTPRKRTHQQRAGFPPHRGDVRQENPTKLCWVWVRSPSRISPMALPIHSHSMKETLCTPQAAINGMFNISFTSLFKASGDSSPRPFAASAQS